MELYVHIPFCVSKCRYCDFYSLPCVKKSAPVAGVYIEALMKELAARKGEIADKKLTSIFIGGGTPSILTCNELEELFTGIYKELDIDVEWLKNTGKSGNAVPEITIECNPGTLDREKLTLMRQLGVNRLSIGLQSAIDSELAELGRIHTFGEFLKNYESARELGFGNISVDLMSGIPGQTADSCRKSLETVAGLAPEHISTYSLILEEGTPLYNDVMSGKTELPGEDSDREMYELTGRVLAAHGYMRYEISNYAKTGFECRHNIGYWTGEEYLGIGPAAASYLGAEQIDGPAASGQTDGPAAASYLGAGQVMFRYKNPNDLKAYMENPSGVRCIEERLERKDLMSEFMILGLRLVRGVSKADFLKRFGESPEDVYGDVINKQVKLGLLEDRDDYIALTSRGLDLANSVMCEFMP
ncbi:MAG: radical SAM family heme chaperone HemW [Lachnospiraceae bacterium]|nr:radical SAM family heme chaperone HemW [Lachnospiraceae bacterium]